MDSQQPLEYETPQTRAQSRQGVWLYRLSLGAVLVAIAIVAGWSVPVCETEWRVDAVTGSMMTRTNWMFGFTTERQYVASPLEVRLSSAGIAWTPDPRVLSASDQNAFGATVARGCGDAPPIYMFRPLLADLCAAASDEELREFVRVLQFGTEEQQEAAIVAVTEDLLKLWESQRLPG